jgi:hypothetical protein
MTIRRIKFSLLDFFWFLFIAIVLGQLGSLFAIFDYWWSTKCLIEGIDQHAKTGNLIAFSTGLLASSGYFLVREYNRKREINNRTIKSILILLAVLFGVAGTLVLVKLTQIAAVDDAHMRVHWFVYLASIIVSVCLWFVDEAEQPGSAFVNEINENSSSMTESASQKTQTSAGMKI